MVFSARVKHDGALLGSTNPFTECLAPGFALKKPELRYQMAKSLYPIPHFGMTPLHYHSLYRNRQSPNRKKAQSEQSG
jgi:uncharacterized protein YbbC (DUF1343 family)